MSKRVRLQKTKILRSKKDASHGEFSPYWDKVHSQTTQGEENLTEHPCANPDVLAETEIALPSTPQLIFGEAVERLAGRQREVYMLLMRESKTYEEVSEILGITRGAAQMYEKRAIRFIKGYCDQAIQRGRV